MRIIRLRGFVILFAFVGIINAQPPQIQLAQGQKLAPPDITIDDDFSLYWGDLTPDGSRLVTSNWGSKANKYHLRVWDTRTGKSLGTFLPGDFYNISVKSPDQRYIATQMNEGPCQIIDTRQGREYAAALGKLYFSMLSFSPQGRFLWVEERRADIKEPRNFVVDPESGKVLHTFPGNKGPHGVLGFTSRDDLVFWNAAAKKAEVRRLPALDLIWERNLAEPSVFSADRRLLLARDGTATAAWIIWDVAIGTSWPLRDPDGKPFAGETAILDYNARFFSPGNHYLALASSNLKEVGIWNAKTGEWHRQIPFAWNSFGHGAFSPDGSRLGLATRYDQFTLFETASGKKLWHHQPEGKWNFQFDTHSRDVHINGRWISYRLDGATGKKLDDEQGGLVEAGDFLLVHEPVGKDETNQRIRVLERATRKPLHDLRVPAFSAIRLAEGGRTMVTEEQTKAGYRFRIWRLPQKQ